MRKGREIGVNKCSFLGAGRASCDLVNANKTESSDMFFHSGSLNYSSFIEGESPETGKGRLLRTAIKRKICYLSSQLFPFKIV